ncbi:MAG: flavodoxin family protein [Candidatus Omnitrophica bacterium]|nr:flavodoxin family protein [Candidatus Omnitrophota bacterium]
MKILLISSSPRKEKSQTFFLAKEALKGLSGQDINSEIIHLADCHIGFCRHCEECHRKILHCSIKDGASAVLKKMLEADGIILASPNYINQVTASMKALLDRSSHFIHCKRLLGKYIVAVVSSGSGESKEILDYIRFYAHICGAQYSGGASSAGMQASPAAIAEARQLGNKLSQDIREKTAYPQQIEIIEQSKQHFKELIKARKTEWQEEHQYWLRQGWL